jgi:hypothetical protein
VIRASLTDHPEGLRGRIFWNQGKKRVQFETGETLLLVLSNGTPLVVPSGFITDFRTVPRILRPLVDPFIPQMGRHNLPTLVHDYLTLEERRFGFWWTQREFYRWLRAYNNPPIKAAVMTAAVIFPGFLWWQKGGKIKASGSAS